MYGHWYGCSGALPASDDVAEVILRFDQEDTVLEVLQRAPLQIVILVHEDCYYRENESLGAQLRNFDLSAMKFSRLRFLGLML